MVALLTVLTTLASFSLQPQILSNFVAHPWGFVFPALAIAGLAGMLLMKNELKAFISSCVFIAGMLTSAAFGVFPYVLPSNTNRAFGLTIYNTAPAEYGLSVGLLWWIPGMLLALGYTVFLYRRFRRKGTDGIGRIRKSLGCPTYTGVDPAYAREPVRAASSSRLC